VAELMQGYLQRERQLQDLLDQLSTAPLNSADAATLQTALSYQKALSEGSSSTVAPKDSGCEMQSALELPGAQTFGAVAESPAGMAGSQRRISQLSELFDVPDAKESFGQQRRVSQLSELTDATGASWSFVEQRRLSQLSELLPNAKELSGEPVSFGDASGSVSTGFWKSILAEPSSGSTTAPAVAEPSSGSTRAPAVDSSPGDTFRSAHAVRRDLVDGFNQACHKAESSPDIWRSATCLQPKMKELRALVSEACSPRSLLRMSPMRDSRQGAASVPVTNARPISPAPRAVSPARILRVVSPGPHRRVSPHMPASPPVTSVQDTKLSTSGLHAPVSAGTPPFPALPTRLHYGHVVPASVVFSASRGLHAEQVQTLTPPAAGDALTASSPPLRPMPAPSVSDTSSVSTPRQSGLMPVYC